MMTFWKIAEKNAQQNSLKHYINDTFFVSYILRYEYFIMLLRHISHCFLNSIKALHIQKQIGNVFFNPTLIHEKGKIMTRKNG